MTCQYIHFYIRLFEYLIQPVFSSQQLNCIRYFEKDFDDNHNKYLVQLLIMVDQVQYMQNPTTVCIIHDDLKVNSKKKTKKLYLHDVQYEYEELPNSLNSL